MTNYKRKCKLMFLLRKFYNKYIKNFTYFFSFCECHTTKVALEASIKIMLLPPTTLMSVITY